MWVVEEGQRRLIGEETGKQRKKKEDDVDAC
jgi:hypothetical protein